MRGKTNLITGASDGLGRGVAGVLDTTVRTYQADPPSLKEVRSLAEEPLGAEDRIDVLIANAGIGGGPRRESADGHELHFAVNSLSQFLLITRLLGRLRASAPARIVLVSSPRACTPHRGCRRRSFTRRAGLLSIRSNEASQRPRASPSIPSLKVSPVPFATESVRLHPTPGPRTPKPKSDCGSSANSCPMPPKSVRGRQHHEVPCRIDQHEGRVAVHRGGVPALGRASSGWHDHRWMGEG